MALEIRDFAAVIPTNLFQEKPPLFINASLAYYLPLGHILPVPLQCEHFVLAEKNPPSFLPLPLHCGHSTDS